MPPLLPVVVESTCDQVRSCCSSLGPPSSLTRGASRNGVISEKTIRVLPSFLSSLHHSNIYLCSALPFPYM
jgi:hypothetical protein